MGNRAAGVVISGVLALSVCPGAAAEKLPSITKAEREMTEAPGEPSAPAVFLIQRGTIHLRNFALQDVATTIKVQARVKILKEEGKSRGEVTIAHSDKVSLMAFEGRTITPAGKVIKVDSQGKFKRKVSEVSKRRVTSIAFPEVEVGSILEYEYDLAFDNFYLVEPWYFMDEIPVLRSEVVWEVPIRLVSSIWRVPTYGVQIETEQKKRSEYNEVRFWATNLPSTPNEVHGYPFRDLAARVLVVPVAYRDIHVNVSLMESWSAVCAIVDEGYASARKESERVAVTARNLTAERPGAEIPLVLYQFVRDKVKNLDGDGPWLPSGTSVDRVLTRGEGTPSEKALLLQSLLSAAHVDADLVWAADSRKGIVFAEVPNPDVFDRVLVRARPAGGSPIFLDPVDPSLGAGRLSLGYEGTVAVVHDPKTPETITLPLSSFGAHRASARVDLAIDAEGRTSGRGEVTYRGHAAWEKSRPDRSTVETQEAWNAWAAGALPGFQISEVNVEDNPDGGTLTVSWMMTAAAESVLGDEVSLAPARPLGPTRQPFTVSEAERRSPVRLDHAGIEEVEMKVTWPEGWSVLEPWQPSSFANQAGVHGVEVSVDAASRSLVTKRSTVIRKREPVNDAEFAALRALFAEAEKRDAQTVVIARR